MQRQLIDALLTHFKQDDSNTKKIETHCSVIYVTKDIAYKLKKSVDFGFLDYSTLEKRKHFCEEEIRLNKRLAENLYLEVIPVSGTPEAPTINTDDMPIEYLVKMRAFDSQSQLDLNLDKLDEVVMKKVAQQVAIFHKNAPQVDANSDWGTLKSIQVPVEQNFEQIAPLIDDKAVLDKLKHIKTWADEKKQQLSSLITRRKDKGYIRECHGDMHLRNMAFDDDGILIFDGIEFNDSFRFIDTLSDIAFLLMDLESKNMNALANVLMDEYLALTGDYSGVPLLNFYKVYRAMVRAKVAAFQMRDGNDDGNGNLNNLYEECLTYINLALHYTQPAPLKLVITIGVSGSGKTTESFKRVQEENLIRLRSDIERKRLFKSPQYTTEEHVVVYTYLYKLAQTLLQNNISVIIDATFLRQAHRKPFKALAETLNANFEQIWCEANEQTLIERIEKRSALGEDVSDATIDVMKQQLIALEAIEEE